MFILGLFDHSLFNLSKVIPLDKAIKEIKGFRFLIVLTLILSLQELIVLLTYFNEFFLRHFILRDAAFE